MYNSSFNNTTSYIRNISDNVLNNFYDYIIYVLQIIIILYITKIHYLIIRITYLIQLVKFIFKIIKYITKFIVYIIIDLIFNKKKYDKIKSNIKLNKKTENPENNYSIETCDISVTKLNETASVDQYTTIILSDSSEIFEDK